MSKTYGRAIVSIMQDEGVPFTAEEKKEAIRDIDTAVKEGRIEFIHKDGKNIGFATYSIGEGIFLEYCFIYKRFRNRTNLVGLRKVFREKSNNFRWKSRRRGRLCEVK